MARAPERRRDAARGRRVGLGGRRAGRRPAPTRRGAGRCASLVGAGRARPPGGRHARRRRGRAGRARRRRSGTHRGVG
ncbi:MAG: hypothetical protein EA416_04640 [Trueperaceae bacterium]|nr:MAG: hypothetical protein EA416_04640 [Trueperaceae bacterium]